VLSLSRFTSCRKITQKKILRLKKTLLSFLLEPALRQLTLFLASVAVAAGQVAPSFTTQPISRSAVVGGNVTFTVAASGTAPLAYQWYKDGIEVAGATGSSFTISGVKLSDGGSYQASVSNASTQIRAVSTGGRDDGGRAHTMYVKTDGTLWANGRNDRGQLGDGTTTYPCAPVRMATGVASVSGGRYHTMYVRTDGTLWAMGLNSSGQLGDGTTTSRNAPVQVAAGVASVSTGWEETMYVKTDGILWARTAGSSKPAQIAAGLLSNVATLTLLPTITTQLNSSSVATGGVARFSVVATGAAPLTYQWMKDGTPISGATSSTYTIASTKTTDAGSYTVTVINSAGSVTSNPKSDS
jgi:hypothetical protein